MKSITFTLLLLLSLSAIAYLIFEERQDGQSQDKLATETNSPTSEKTKPLASEALPTEQGIAQPQSDDNHSDNQAPLVITSSKQLVAQMIDDNDIIDGQQVTKLLNGDFADYVDLIQSQENQDEMGSKRQASLADSLANLQETIYSEKYACAGRICTLSLTTDTMSQQSIDKLSEFDKNYAFIKQTQLDTGETLFQAIYLQTDDPSTMRFKGY